MNVQQAASPRLCTGNGQSDTHAITISTKDGDKPNPSPTAGTDYSAITAKEIAAMAANPASCDKMAAPWFIGSDYRGPDARSHEAQRTRGTFYVLPVDIDQGAHSLDTVTASAEAVAGDGVSFIAYSSSGATADNPKWRVLFFASPPIPGDEYSETQDAIFDLFEMEGITCDRALNRTGQLIFLPNVPPAKRGPDGAPLFYQHHLQRGRTLNITPDSLIGQRRDAVRASVKYAQEQMAKRQQKAVTRRDTSDDISPVDAFNDANSLADTMLRYGYEQQGRSDHWRSPNQTSGSYAVRVFEGRTWVSLSGSDLAAGIGAQKDFCAYGDAFDLFVHYEHQGDYTAAVRAYGREINPPTVLDPAGQGGGSLADDFGSPVEVQQTAIPEPAQNPVGGISDATPPAPQDQAEEQGNERLKKYAFLAGDGEFYHMATGQSMSVSNFNLAMARHTGPVQFQTADGPVEKRFPAAKTLLEYLGGQIAQSTMYRPDCAGDPHIISDGIKFINSYRPKSVPGSDPHWAEKVAWKICKDHVENILGEHAAIIIQWMAHNVQRPGRKILWAPIIVGVQGDGKTTLAKMLAAVMGKANVGAVSPEAMFSEFTGWAEGACVKVLEEIRVHGNSRHDAMNKLKPLITNDMIEVVRKGKDGKQVVNVTNYMALTNFMDALAIDEGDRRWAVFKTKFDAREDMLAEFDDTYWDALHTAIDTQPEVIRGWLLDVDLTGFNPKAAPDVSQFKREMMDLTRSPDQVDVEEAIALGAFGVTENLLATDCLNEAIFSATASRINTKRLAMALAAAGWVRMPGVIKWKGKTRRTWFKKSARLGAATTSEMRKILDTSVGEYDL